MCELPAMRVSIVVACRNERNGIRDLLESILSQDMTEPWEAIIADGMSTDGTREILNECSTQNSWLRVIDNPEYIVSTGLNSAIKAARGEIIIRMDAHTKYASGYCRTCVDVLEQTGADNVGGPARTRANTLLGRAISAAYHSRFSTGGARFHDVDYRGWVDTVPYGCWRKATLERFGLFDASLVRNQDDELNLRLVRAGAKIWQDPRIVSWYSPRANLSRLFYQYFQYGYWKVAVIRKHRLPASWRHLVPVLWLLVNSLLLLAMAVAKVTASSKFFVLASVLWACMALCYVGTSVAAAVWAGKNQWEILPYLPAVFATYHLSYGMGFTAGLFSFWKHSDRPSTASNIFTRITR